MGEPLTPFEHLMLVDARPGYPMCFFIECVVEGPLEADRLRRAVEHASQRHPRFRSRVAWRGNHPHWLTPDVHPAFVWLPDPAGLDPWRPVDLERESGVRIVTRTLGQTLHSVIMMVHHCVCDGIAACEFLGDLWSYYDGREPPELRHCSTRRNEGVMTTCPSLPDMLGEAFAFLRFVPHPLALMPCHGTATHEDAFAPPYASIDLDEHEAVRLRRAASARRATVNDLVLAAVMRAAIAWNDCGGTRHGGVRVTVPVSTRESRQRQPARNTISYAFIDRHRDACRDRESLAQSIASASRWILSSGAVGGFLEAVRLLRRSAWMLKATTRLPICLSTVVVSNLGDVSRRMRSALPRTGGRLLSGGVVIRGFRGVPPLRPRTRASVLVLQYAGAMTICCLYSDGTAQRTAGRAFLELIRSELQLFT